MVTRYRLLHPLLLNQSLECARRVWKPSPSTRVGGGDLFVVAKIGAIFTKIRKNARIKLTFEFGGRIAIAGQLSAPFERIGVKMLGAPALFPSQVSDDRSETPSKESPSLLSTHNTSSMTCAKLNCPFEILLDQSINFRVPNSN